MSACSCLVPAADGTCVQLTQCGTVWMVRGRAGWYRCDAEHGLCSCEALLFGRARSLTACRHLRALAAYLMTAEMVRLSITTQRTPEEQEAREAHIRHIIDEDTALPSQAELREMFR